MDYETIFGLILVGSALGIVIALTYWCRHIIDQINARSPSSLREIQQQQTNGSKN